MQQLYKVISKSLHSRMLGHALAILRPVVMETGDALLTEQFQSIHQNYRYLVDYFLSGTDDPRRSELIDVMIHDTYELLDEVYLANRLQNKTDYEIREMLRPENCVIPTYPDPESVDNADPTFRTMWLSKPDADHLQLFRNLIADSAMEIEAYLAISGLTLSLLRSFSEQGFLALIEAAEEQYAIPIRERAWVGVLLLLLVYDDRLRFFPDIIAAVQDLLDSDDQRVFATTAMVCIVRTLGVDWANEAFYSLQKSISPLINKLMPKSMESENISQDELDDFSAHLDKDFQEILEENRQEMMRLAEENMDTHFAMFKDMYSSSFFSKPFRWWLPFDPDYLSEEARNQTPIFRILHMNDLCDSDRFAFLSTLSKIGFINGQSVSELMEQVSNNPNDSEEETYNRILCNDYVRQSYRFFRLNPWNIQNPFTALVHLPDSNVFRLLYTSAADKRIIASCLMHCRAYEMAAKVYAQIADTLHNEEIYGYYGLCLQKIGAYDKALEVYKKMLQLGSSEWLYRQMEYCYSAIKNYDDALQSCELLLQIKPDSRAYLYEKANLLIRLELFAEALAILYKLDFLRPNNATIAHDIIWCALVCDDFDAAIRYFNRLEEMNKTTELDWINIGHVHFIQGKRMNAYQSYRRSMMQMADLKKFLAAFRPDRPLLVEKGIRLDEVYLMEDQLISSWSEN